eukprot:m51a1_g4459 hypothetical protein (156) ;mRNA; f:183644-184531
MPGQDDSEGEAGYYLERKIYPDATTAPSFEVHVQGAMAIAEAVFHNTTEKTVAYTVSNPPRLCHGISLFYSDGRSVTCRLNENNLVRTRLHGGPPTLEVAPHETVTLAVHLNKPGEPSWFVTDIPGSYTAILWYRPRCKVAATFTLEGSETPKSS